MLTQNTIITFGKLNKQAIIWIHAPINAAFNTNSKGFQPTWCTSQQKWYVLDTAYNRTLLGNIDTFITINTLNKIATINHNAIIRMREHLLLKGYSSTTTKTYLNEFCQLLYTIKNNDVNTLTITQLQSYCLYCIAQLKCSINLMHSRINAIKFYYEQVLGWDQFSIDLPRPKKPSLLPKVLSTQEIKKIFAVVTNPKHQLILQLCYGMGLRVSEIVKLKIADINSNNMQVLIACAKGKKDRYVHLPAFVLQNLRAYYKTYRPAYYLFEGTQGGQYSVRSVQQIFKNAMQKANINRPIGIHGLRHSYATHLLEYGTEIGCIQKLLGHKDIKTTLIYTQVSNQLLQKIPSPLDRLY